jgi:hypothetical protein
LERHFGTSSAQDDGGCEQPPTAMPSLLHEGLLGLFRNRPILAAELLRDALHAPLPVFDHARVGDANLTELVPTEYRADLVLLLEAGARDAPLGAIVVEVQLGADADKIWSWPVYLASLRARLRCGVALMVITTDEAVAQWAARPIETGHPGFALTPLVLGPMSVPVVRDEDAATQDPELAVLSVMVHGRGRVAVDVAMAAVAAARRLDDDRATLYVDLVFASIHEAARAILEGLMASKNYEYQSDFAKRYFAQGQERGEALGEARALLGVLEARRIDVSEEVRQRILSCTNLAMLDAWLARALRATIISEVMDE